MIIDPRLPSSPDDDWPIWSRAGWQQELPADLADIDLDVWRICGLDRTLEEECADREEGEMQRGWRE